jgi:hypothetical protein
MHTIVATLALFTVALAPRLAEAGHCVDSSERDDYEQSFLKITAGSRDKATLDGGGTSLHCILEGPGVVGDSDGPPDEKTRLKRRALVTKGCTKLIAARDKKGKESDPSIENILVSMTRSCKQHLVADGVTSVGDHDLFADLTSFKYSWHDFPPYKIVSTSRDSRARLFVLDTFRAAIAGRGDKKPKGSQVRAWQEHRLDALNALAKVGTAEDVAFIDEVIAATPPADKKVLAAAKKARDAAQSRPAGTPP